MRLHPIVRWGLVLIGLGMVAAAILAPQLGLDSNQDWGPSRRLLLAAGILTFALAWLDRARSASAQAVTWLIHTKVVTRASDVPRHFLQSLDSTPSVRRIRGTFAAKRRAWAALLARSPFLAATLGNRRTRVLLAAWGAFLVVSASYAWYASVGMWVAWPGTSAYYDMQAEAFLLGQTHLLIEPDARLLALPNPYDPQARENIPQVWDASLYNGRYYLYWGPVPALLIAPWKAATGIPVGDNALVYLFMLGAVYWCTRILTRTWWTHFPEVPGWIVVATVLTVGWANPLPWLLNTPYVYEAAIAGGQFFLLMGIYAFYPFLGRDTGRYRDLVWAGASLALAVGTRSSLAAAVFVVSTIAVIRLALQWPSAKLIGTAKAMLAFFLPLAFGAAALAAYNQVRFDSPLEFGQGYQLTSVDTSEATSFSPANAPPNLYNYFVNPVRVLSVFPYIKPNWGGVGSSVLRIPVPEGYYSRQVAGLAIVTPFLVYALTAALVLGRTRTHALARGTHALAEQALWLTGTLLAVAVIELAAILTFAVGSMRYEGDFVPSLLVAAALGFWSGIVSRARLGRSFAGWAALGVMLMTWTAVAGLLLGVTSFHSRFEILNPELFDRLTRFFTP